MVYCETNEVGGKYDRCVGPRALRIFTAMQICNCRRHSVFQNHVSLWIEIDRSLSAPNWASARQLGSYSCLRVSSHHFLLLSIGY